MIHVISSQEHGPVETDSAVGIETFEDKDMAACVAVGASTCSGEVEGGLVDPLLLPDPLYPPVVEVLGGVWNQAMMHEI